MPESPNLAEIAVLDELHHIADLGSTIRDAVSTMTGKDKREWTEEKIRGLELAGARAREALDSHRRGDHWGTVLYAMFAAELHADHAGDHRRLKDDSPRKLRHALRVQVVTEAISTYSADGADVARYGHVNDTCKAAGVQEFPSEEAFRQFIHENKIVSRNSADS